DCGCRHPERRDRTGLADRQSKLFHDERGVRAGLQKRPACPSNGRITTDVPRQSCGDCRDRREVSTKMKTLYVLIIVLALGIASARAQTLNGAIDMHAHSYPDGVP